MTRCWQHSDERHGAILHGPGLDWIRGGWQDITIVVEGNLNMDMANRCRIVHTAGDTASDRPIVEVEVHSREDRLTVVLPFRLEDEKLPDGGAKRFGVTPNDSGAAQVVTQWFSNHDDETWYTAEAAVKTPMRGVR